MSVEAGLNPDFLDLLATFLAAEVEFIVVGAHALAANGIVRSTGDLDVWIRSVAIEEVARAKGKVYRLVATGPKGSKLITFTFSDDSAKHCLTSIVQATGWSPGAVPALKSA